MNIQEVYYRNTKIACRKKKASAIYYELNKAIRMMTEIPKNPTISVYNTASTLPTTESWLLLRKREL